MSGGSFNNNGYIYYNVEDFARELEERIEANELTDEYGLQQRFDENVIQLLRDQLPLIKRAARVMKAIDYLYSGDHGEDSFISALERALK